MLNFINMAVWDLGSFLKNSNQTIQQWGGSFIMLIGVVAIIVAAYQIISGLMSHGKNKSIGVFQLHCSLLVVRLPLADTTLYQKLHKVDKKQLMTLVVV